MIQELRQMFPKNEGKQYVIVSGRQRSEDI